MTSGSISISAAGDPLIYTQNATGFFVTARNSTVKILIPDVPIANGVVHVVDGVLIDTNTDPNAAANAISSNAAVAKGNTLPQTGFVSQSLPTSVPSSGSGTTGGSSSGAQNLKSNVSLLILALSGLNFLYKL